MEDKVTLYIATHNITGKKYFGKTIKWFTVEDLQKKYHGSGAYWNNHKNKHGNDVTMEIYQICSLNESDEDYVAPIALKFSEENNIVGSNEWANLIYENGLDGGSSGVPKSDKQKTLLSVIHKNKVVVVNLEGAKFKVTREEYYSNDGLISISKGKKRNKNKHCEYCNKDVYPSEEMYHFEYCYDNPNRLSREVNCQFCNKIFKDSTGLKNHEMICLLNENRRIYNCQFCDKEYKDFRNRNRHELTCDGNLNKQTYSCQFCDKKVKNNSALIKHQNMCDLNPNKIVKVYNCQFCNKEFAKTKINLIKHENHYCELNPNKIPLEFTCNCGKIYRDKGNFTQHINKCQLRVNS